MPAAHILDETNHSFNRSDRIVFQSKCQGKKKHDLRVCASGNFGKKTRRYSQHEIALELRKIRDGTVVLKQPTPMAEGVAIGALDSRSSCGSHMSHEHRRFDL